jgi:hypothetical protein
LNIEPHGEVLLEWTALFTHRKEAVVFKNIQLAPIAAFVASVAFSLLAGCASSAAVDGDLGAPAEGRSYDRKILIKASTTFVNVDDGEVVRFVVQAPDGADKSFTWHFDAFREGVGDLGKLAPAGVLGRSVKVYVGPNPRYH